MPEEKPVIMRHWATITASDWKNIDDVMGRTDLAAEEKWRRLRNIMRDYE